jgi:hypothetical protein
MLAWALVCTPGTSTVWLLHAASRRLLGEEAAQVSLIPCTIVSPHTLAFLTVPFVVNSSEGQPFTQFQQTFVIMPRNVHFSAHPPALELIISLRTRVETTFISRTLCF